MKPNKFFKRIENILVFISISFQLFVSLQFKLNAFVFYDPAKVSNVMLVGLTSARDVCVSA